MEIIGTIIQALPELSGVSKAGNQWKKAEYVLETDGSYPHRVKFTIFGQKVDTLLKPELQKKYKVLFDLDSREFNGRWYTDVNAYGIEAIDGAQAPVDGGFSAPNAAPAGVAPAPTAAPEYNDPLAGGAFAAPAGEKVDDLPF